VKCQDQKVAAAEQIKAMEIPALAALLDRMGV